MTYIKWFIVAYSCPVYNNVIRNDENCGGVSQIAKIEVAFIQLAFDREC
jgi:hypothetical protein